MNPTPNDTNQSGSEHTADTESTRDPPTKKRSLEGTFEALTEGESAKEMGMEANIEVEVKQGLSEDPTSLRANDRTAKFVVTIRGGSEAQTNEIARLLQGDRRPDENSWARLTFALTYSDGEAVELINASKHSEHIDVMEPSGTSATRRKLTESVFTMDSRAQKDKRVAGGPRSFYSGLHLETQVEGTCIVAESKFSTNITSRQHDRRNFVWKVSLDVCFDGEALITSEAQTVEFEYVARRLKAKPAPRKRASTGPRKVAPAVQSPNNDEDLHMGNPYGQAFAPEPVIRRSSRKAAAACRAGLTQMLDGAETGRPAAVQPPQPEMELDEDYDENPMLHEVGASVSYPAFNPYDREKLVEYQEDADEILRRPSKMGLNLSRVESIENIIFNTPGTTRSPPGASVAERFGGVASPPQAGANVSLADRAGGSSLELNRQRSEEKLGLGLERINSSVTLNRCASSTWSLFSVGDEDLQNLTDPSVEEPMPGDGEQPGLIAPGLIIA